MLSPLWLFICLLEAPDGIYAVFWLGLVTGASAINWKGLHTLSKKEKRNQSMSQRKRKLLKLWKKPYWFILSQFQNKCVKCNRIQELPIFSCSLWPGMKVSMGFTVGRPTAWQFTVSRQKMLYATVNRQKCSLRLTVKNFLGVSNLTISADLDGIPAPKEFLNWKNQFSCQETLFLDNTVPYDLLISENILKFGKWKAKTTSKHISWY